MLCSRYLIKTVNEARGPHPEDIAGSVVYITDDPLSSADVNLGQPPTRSDDLSRLAASLTRMGSVLRRGRRQPLDHARRAAQGPRAFDGRGAGGGFQPRFGGGP